MDVYIIAVVENLGYWIHTFLLSGIYITKIITLKNPKALNQNITIK